MAAPALGAGDRIFRRVPELRSVLAEGANQSGGTEQVVLEQLANRELRQVELEAGADGKVRHLSEFLTQQGFARRADLVLGVRVRSESFLVRGLITGYDGGQAGAYLVYEAGATFATAMAVIVGQAAYVVLDNRVVASAEGTERVRGVPRLPRGANETGPQSHCNDCCLLIVLCAGVALCCLSGVLGCCPPGLGICAGAAGRCAACPCGT